MWGCKEDCICFGENLEWPQLKLWSLPQMNSAQRREALRLIVSHGSAFNWIQRERERRDRCSNTTLCCKNQTRPASRPCMLHVLERCGAGADEVTIKDAGGSESSTHHGGVTGKIVWVS